jgi:hypothetical protein
MIHLIDKAKIELEPNNEDFNDASDEEHSEYQGKSGNQ